MTVVNEREHAGENSERVFTLTVSDTNEHDLPDVDGDDSAGGDPFSTEAGGKVAVKVHNEHGQDATARLEATNLDDSGFTKAETVVGNVTVAANGGTETLVGDHDAPFDWYRVVVSYATAPSDGDSVEAAYMTSYDE